MRRSNLVIVLLLLFAAAFTATAKTAKGGGAFAQGCAAFKDGDWSAAMMLLRRSTADEKYDTDSTWYMLIMAEMNGGAADEAGMDCDTFMAKFPESQYLPLIQYQKGRTLYMAGEYDKCTLLLSDFCHQYPSSAMYPSALFWIAESFFTTADYDEAGALYTRIAEEFPASDKAAQARYRLETIASRKREEQLLYLLKKTGEEYMATKEDYERQLMMGLGAAGVAAEAGGMIGTDNEGAPIAANDNASEGKASGAEGLGKDGADGSRLGAAGGTSKDGSRVAAVDGISRDGNKGASVTNSASGKDGATESTSGADGSRLAAADGVSGDGSQVPPQGGVSSGISKGGTPPNLITLIQQLKGKAKEAGELMEIEQ